MGVRLQLWLRPKQQLRRRKGPNRRACLQTRLQTNLLRIVSKCSRSIVTVWPLIVLMMARVLSKMFLRNTIALRDNRAKWEKRSQTRLSTWGSKLRWPAWNQQRVGGCDIITSQSYWGRRLAAHLISGPCRCETLVLLKYLIAACLQRHLAFVKGFQAF